MPVHEFMPSPFHCKDRKEINMSVDCFIKWWVFTIESKEKGCGVLVSFFIQSSFERVMCSRN